MFIITNLTVEPYMYKADARGVSGESKLQSSDQAALFDELAVRACWSLCL